MKNIRVIETEEKRNLCFILKESFYQCISHLHWYYHTRFFTGMHEQK